MARESHPWLSARERQIMEIIDQQGKASGAEGREALPDSPGCSAVRAVLRFLEDRGTSSIARMDGKTSSVPRRQAARDRRSALKNRAGIFSPGPVGGAVASLLSLRRKGLSHADPVGVARLIDRAREKGEGS